MNRSSLYKMPAWGIALLLLSGLMTLTGPLHAQGTLKDQQFFYGKIKNGLSGKATLSLSLLKGQTDSETLSIAGNLGYASGKVRTQLSVAYLYNKVFNLHVVSDAWGAGLTSSYQFGKNFSMQALLSREHDKSQFLFARDWLGGAFMYRLIDLDKNPKHPSAFVLTCGAGAVWENEKFYNITLTAKEPSISFIKAVSILYFAWTIKPGISLTSTTHFLFAFKDFKENDIHISVSQITALSKHFALTTSLKYKYDNTVAYTGMSNYSMTLVTGLTIMW